MLIDFHVHAFSEKIVARTMEKLTHSCKLIPETDGTLKNTLEVMDKYGVDICVIMNIATKPSQHGILLDFAQQTKSERIYHFASVYPFAYTPEEEQRLETDLIKIKAAGIKGIKLHPDYQEFMADDPHVFKIYEICQALGLYIMFHAGLDFISPDLIHNNPSAMLAVRKNFKSLGMIAAHLGGYAHWNEVLQLIAGHDIYIDTSMTSCLPDDNLYKAIISKHGAENILFASDCPWNSPALIYNRIKSFDLPADDEELIFHKNAEHILSLD